MFAGSFATTLSKEFAVSLPPTVPIAPARPGGGGMPVSPEAAAATEADACSLFARLLQSSLPIATQRQQAAAGAAVPQPRRSAGGGMVAAGESSKQHRNADGPAALQAALVQDLAVCPIQALPAAPVATEPADSSADRSSAIAQADTKRPAGVPVAHHSPGDDPEATCTDRDAKPEPADMLASLHAPVSRSGAGDVGAPATLPTALAMPLAAATQVAHAAAGAPPGEPAQGHSPPAAPTAQVQAVLVRIAAAGGSQTVSISLHPAELGRVEVHVERSDVGRLQVTLTAERPETLHALMHDQAQLGEALDRAGLSAEGRVLSFHVTPADRPPAATEAAPSTALEPVAPSSAGSPADFSGASLAGNGGGHAGRQAGRGQDRRDRPSFGIAGAAPDEAQAGPAGTGWLRLGIDITA